MKRPARRRVAHPAGAGEGLRFGDLTFPQIRCPGQARTSFLATVAAGLIRASPSPGGGGAMSFVQQLADAISTTPVRALDTLSRSIWQGLAAGALNDDDAQRLAELIHVRRTAAREAPAKPAQRRVGSRPRTTASMERRRSWAAAGRLPPQIASRFTLAEQAVLAVVAAEVVKGGACRLAIDHIAALAGVGRSTVKRALREAHGLGLIRIEERRLSAWRNDTNVITVVSPEWSAWLRLRRGGGGQFGTATNTSSNSEPMRRTNRAGFSAKPRRSGEGAAGQDSCYRRP